MDQIHHSLNLVESPQTIIPYSIETPSESPVEEYYPGIERLEEEFQKLDKERLQLLEELREVKVAENQDQYNFNLDNQIESEESEESAEEQENNNNNNLEARMANQILFKPRIFYGEEREDPVEWMNEFKKAARINRWETDAQKRNAMEIYLKEDAEEWWLELMNVEAGNEPTWEVMEESFWNTFNNRRWKNKALSELNNLRIRRNESIRAYAGQFKKICKRIDNLTEERKAEYFLRGLTPELASLALTHEKETVEDIVSLIEKYEEGRDITNRIEPKIKKRKEKRYEIETESESESEEEAKRKIKKDYTKEKQKKKEEEKTKPEDDIEELIKKMAQLKIQMAGMNNQGRNNYNNYSRNNNYSPNYRYREPRCFSCGKLGHLIRDCRQQVQRPRQWDQNIPNNYNNHNDHNSNNPNNNNNFRNNNQRNNNPNGPKSKQLTYTNYVNTENNNESEDEVTKELIEILVGKHGRDSDSDSDFQIKKPRTDNIIKTTYTPMEIQHTGTLGTFGIKPTKKDNKKKIKPITWKKSKTDIKKDKKEVPLLLRGLEFDIVKQLEKQKVELTLSQVLQLDPKQKKKLLKALRKPKELDIKLVNQNLIPKTTVLECQVEIDGNDIPAIIDSGAAASIVTRDTIEQLGYEPEEASNCEIITATGERSKSLGRIRDFPITINGKQIPIDVEVMEADSYHLLLGNNWMTKAGAIYDWKKSGINSYMEKWKNYSRYILY